MNKKLITYLRNFSRDHRGTVSVEAAIILPLMLWTFVAMWVFFDVYKTRSMTEKAAYTVSDMLSRETNAIDDEYLDGAKNLFDLLADSSTASAAGLRVSVISYSGAYADYELEWSQVRGNIEAMDGADMTDLIASLPTMADGETLILVQTTSTYEPPLNVGLGDQTLETFIFVRPRFGPQLDWDGSV